MASPLRLSVAPGSLTAPASSGSARRVAADAAAARAWRAVVATFEAAEQSMSRFRPTSELSALNRTAGTGAAISVSRQLVRALVAADRARRITDGRFDPRVARELERLGYGGAGGVVTAGRSSTAGTGQRIIGRTGRRSDLRIDDPIDLGGIGKGLALRWAVARAATTLRPVLQAGGGFLLEAGGDLVVRGVPPGDDAWSIGVQDPSGGEAPLAVIRPPSDHAVATSSIRINRWRSPDGRAVHHLLDPRTGEPGGRGLTAVTVSAPDPAWAEVWSKALFLEGAAGIAALARERGLAAWWVTVDGVLEMTAAARVLTSWVAQEA
jgi:thiamine biosynthesis lipoprotein